MLPLKTVARSSFTAVGLACLLAMPLEAGEKIRFGPASGVIPQTQPERSAGPALELRPASERIRPVQAALPSVATPVVAAPPSAAAGANQDDWIFGDTRSQEGVRQALGVNNYDPSQMTPRDSVEVIQDYFARQKPQNTPQPAGLPSASGQWGLGSGATTFPGLAPKLEGIKLPTDEGTGSLYGDSSFRNTLNSDNPAVRRYFRDLYTTPSVASALSSPAPGQSIDPLRPPTADANATGSSSASSGLSDFAQRAALIDSLTPTTPLAPTFDSGRPAPEATRTSDPRVPAGNNGQLIERRNGLIVIPGRKF